MSFSKKMLIVIIMVSCLCGYNTYPLSEKCNCDDLQKLTLKNAAQGIDNIYKHLKEVDLQEFLEKWDNKGFFKESDSSASLSFPDVVDHLKDSIATMPEGKKEVLGKVVDDARSFNVFFKGFTKYDFVKDVFSSEVENVKVLLKDILCFYASHMRRCSCGLGSEDIYEHLSSMSHSLVEGGASKLQIALKFCPSS